MMQRLSAIKYPSSRPTGESLKNGILSARSYYFCCSLTIHKCQGQTLERVIVDLGEIFEVDDLIACIHGLTYLNRQDRHMSLCLVPSAW